MIRLKIPECDWALVSHLSKLSNKPELWQRSNGRPGRFKKEITAYLKVEQNNRCAYCNAKLHEESPHRDHIAPKEQYPEWTFRPENLVLSCYACNSDRKKAYNPVACRRRKYKLCTFRFIHPYFDNADRHLSYIGDEGGVIIRSLSSKGHQTIELFYLDSPERTKQRAKDSLFDHELSHLHGKWRSLFQGVVDGVVGLKMRPK